MNYIETLHDPRGKMAHYKVINRNVPVAEFSYHVSDVAGRQENARQFWLDEVALADSCRSFEMMEPILLFVQYKCFQIGMSEIFIRISAKNLFYLELYRRFGFFVMDERAKQDRYGKTGYEYVLKYAVPFTRDEQDYRFRKRKEWK